MSDDTIVADPPQPAPPPSKRPMSAGDKVRFALRGVGQTLITAGLVVLLFVVYEVWITNIFAHAAQNKVHNALKKEWANGKDPLLPLPGSKDPTIPLGTGIANLYLPRLGTDYHFTIVQGSTVPTDAQLEKGPAHYGGTALPGQVGNFSVAGHRVGKGEPFLNLDKLRSHDAVIVETKSWWYVYRVKGGPPGGDPQTDTLDADKIPGREIVSPDEGRVLLPIPNDTNANDKPTERLMTMTTCHPKFTATQRMIVHAAYAMRVPVQMTDGKRVSAMPPQIKSLYAEVKA